jgi:hypothetical protein
VKGIHRYNVSVVEKLKEAAKTDEIKQASELELIPETPMKKTERGKVEPETAEADSLTKQ